MILGNRLSLKEKDRWRSWGVEHKSFALFFFFSVRSRAFSYGGEGGGDKTRSLARLILLNELYSMVGPWRTPGASCHLSSHTVSK